MLERVSRGEIVKEQWTFYPQGGGPKTLLLTVSGIRIDGGRIAILAETEQPDKETFNEGTVRGVGMLMHLPFAVSQFSIDGNLMYQNPAALSYFGTPPATLENPQDLFLCQFVDRELGKSALKQVQEGNNYSVEVELYTQLGPRWFSVDLRRTRDPVTSEYIILHSARDISDIVNAREETNRAAMKSEFIAVMAHEIRTPLHQIVGYLDLLALTKLSKEQLGTIKEVQSSTSLLMSIVNDLLDFSKLESCQVQVESVSFSMTGVCNGCIAAAESDATEKGLTLRSHIASDVPPKFVGDPNRLRQILLNLLTNAVKFTAKGFVSLSVTSADGERIRFEVSDSGIGIDPSHQKIVFEKYRQANASVARNYGGTGLGLAICKGLAELMGGTIDLKSQVDKGTTVVVEIPFHLPKEVTNESADPEERDALAEETEGLRLLVVEDNKINQKVARSILQRMGHTVTVAENGQLALDELRKRHYDLVLMDVQMPVMDGIECTKQIRGILGLRREDLPVVGVTASFQHSDLEYYQRIGMNTCLGKPLRMLKLKQVISDTFQCIDRKRLPLPLPTAERCLDHKRLLPSLRPGDPSTVLIATGKCSSDDDDHSRISNGVGFIASHTTEHTQKRLKHSNDSI
jgi:signal transduction histidine kinase/CheY-like chemotaxis protein